MLQIQVQIVQPNSILQHKVYKKESIVYFYILYFERIISDVVFYFIKIFYFVYVCKMVA